MDEHKVAAVADGIRSLIALDDPVGVQLLATELDDGLILRKITCPIGVIGIIFESRPDALVQIACLCLKSGNAVILKGGSEASETNRYLTELIKEASSGDGRGVDGGTGVSGAGVGGGGDGGSGESSENSGSGVPDGWITQLETRDEIKDMLRMDGDIDLSIPRGSNEFVRYIMDNTRIPVIGHADGLCHSYVDAAADIELAVKVVADAKTQYAAVCNATETLLVHRDAARDFLPALWRELNGGDGGDGDIGEGEDGGDGGGKDDNGSIDGKEAYRTRAKPYVTFKGCAETRAILANRNIEAATDDDWGAEYLDYVLSIKIVGSVKEAIDHINRFGSKHTDAIITEDDAAAREFMRYVDSANVYHNCSTRFSDGFRYGFGAEVGVSTSKIHARGPVGLEGLVTYKYLLSGRGAIVADYEQGKRKFTHKRI
jgi:glutamate-5-semialdehyde dehydrogenase